MLLSGFRVALVGGAGDLGLCLGPALEEKGACPRSLDIVTREGADRGVRCDILDRDELANAFRDTDAVVHIAAWHGVHEYRREKGPYEFWDLNVTGTFNVLQAAVAAGVSTFLYISSTSVLDPGSLYGDSKVIGERLVHQYVHRHGLNALILRPRAFIPHWNRRVYVDFVDWVRWYWRGAVHIDDVSNATVLALECLRQGGRSDEPLVIDGKYDYSPEELERWDATGPGSTFSARYGRYAHLIAEHGLDPTLRPEVMGSDRAEELIGYRAQYSLSTCLDQLQRFGSAGPEAPDHSRVEARTSR